MMSNPNADCENSDPAYFGGNYILDNYCAVHDAFNLSIEEWKIVCQNSIRGSWCSESRKNDMLEKLEEVIAKFSHAK